MARESDLKIKWKACVLAAVLAMLFIAAAEKLMHKDGNLMVLPIAGRAWADPIDTNDPNSGIPQGPFEPNFAVYYEPYELGIQPNAPGYTLPLDLGIVSNYTEVEAMFGLEDAVTLIERNGFVVIEHDFGTFDPNRDDIVEPYEYLSDKNVPLFITADVLLHLYHVQFDETLKRIEQEEFYGDIRDLTTGLLNHALILYEQYSGDLKEAARRNVAYLSVARQLIGSSIPAPEMVSGEVAGELAKIEAHYGFAPSDIFVYGEDYSQYVPRGHYTRSDILKKYFKTLMWYGRMAFLIKGHEKWGSSGEALVSPYDAKIQTLQACLLAVSLDTQQIGHRSAREIWDRIYTVTAFYVGLADDLTPYDYLWALDRVFGGEYALSDLEDPNHYHELKTELALLPAPRIFGGTGDVKVHPPLTEESLNEVLDKTKGMRLMGQRFIPDSYMFQNLLYPRVEDYSGDLSRLPFTSVVTPSGIFRGYPRGLDVMALLGSEPAKTILMEEGDTDYVNYWLRFCELEAAFGAFGVFDWNRNLYWGWLYSLRALLDELPDGYPNFMRTQAWQKKELNVALASWTELRHDTILYAKQSSMGPPYSGSPTPPGYVEPVPEFYGRLKALAQMTREGLRDLGALTERGAQNLKWYETTLSLLIDITNKELTNQELSPEDWEFIKKFGEYMEPLTETGLAGAKTILVADVHTCSSEMMVLEEAVGKVDLIVVACPQPDGSAFLAAGSVLSYYEFKHPMEDRLTDERWRELLDAPNKPERPAWYRSLMR